MRWIAAPLLAVVSLARRHLGGGRTAAAATGRPNPLLWLRQGHRTLLRGASSPVDWRCWQQKPRLAGRRGGGEEARRGRRCCRKVAGYSRKVQVLKETGGWPRGTRSPQFVHSRGRGNFEIRMRHSNSYLKALLPGIERPPKKQDERQRGATELPAVICKSFCSHNHEGRPVFYLLFNR